MTKRTRSCLSGVAFVILVAGMSGCATNRGVIRPAIPQGMAAESNGLQIFLRNVTDNRVFEENPQSPDIPSLGFEGAEGASDDIKARAVGRKRNTYGKALGDVILEEGMTVASVMRELQSNALRNLGYEMVHSEADARPDAIVMDVSIEQYWGWFNPGFWTITLEARIVTEITITAPGEESIRIKAEGRYEGGSANTNAWLEIFRLVHVDYIEKTKEAIGLLKFNTSSPPLDETAST